MKTPERNVIGILTANVRLFYDLTKYLKGKKIRFRILDFGTDYPPDIGVILTSPEELDSVNFEPKVGITDIETGVRQARVALNGIDENHTLVIGVDPGPEPGIAALLGLHVIETCLARSPEHAAEIIFGILSDYRYSVSVLRMGNGAPKQRDRILELVSGNFDMVEIVDEAGTSNCIRGFHEDAAVKIAMFGD